MNPGDKIFVAGVVESVTRDWNGEESYIVMIDNHKFGGALDSSHNIKLSKYNLITPRTIKLSWED